MNPFFYFLYIIFLLSLLTQLFFLRFSNLNRFKNKSTASKSPENENLPPVSIIICAHNEAFALSKHLPYIIHQKYTNNDFEIIVVNDASTDETEKVLAGFQEQFPYLRVINITPKDNRIFPGKKFALHQGLSTASHELVLLTDADCKPASEFWLQTFAKTYLHSEKPIILGHGAFEIHKGWVNKMVQWETLQTCMRYAGMALAGLPYMGVGRNLFYEKRLYFEAIQNEEFLKTYTALPSGDDDLLIGQMAQNHNVALCLAKEAHTISTAPQTFSEWLRQKKRHISAGKYYPTKIKNILGLWELSSGLFWLTWTIIIIEFFVSIATHHFSIPYYLSFGGLILGFVRVILYWLNAKKWYQILNVKNMIFSYPIGEICLLAYQALVIPYIFWKNKQQWK